MNYHEYEEMEVLNEEVKVAIDTLKEIVDQYDMFKNRKVFFQCSIMKKPAEGLILNAFVNYNGKLHFNIRNLDTGKIRNLPLSDIIQEPL